LFGKRERINKHGGDQAAASGERKETTEGKTWTQKSGTRASTARHRKVKSLTKNLKKTGVTTTVKDERKRLKLAQSLAQREQRKGQATG